MMNNGDEGSSTPHGAREEGGRKFDLVRLHDDHFDPQRWEKSVEFKRQMSHVAAHPQGPAPLEKLKEHEPGPFTGNEVTQFAMHPAKNPNEKGSFGFVATIVTIEAKGPSSMDCSHCGSIRETLD